MSEKTDRQEFHFIIDSHGEPDVGIPSAFANVTVTFEPKYIIEDELQDDFRKAFVQFLSDWCDCGGGVMTRDQFQEILRKQNEREDNMERTREQNEKSYEQDQTDRDEQAGE